MNWLGAVRHVVKETVAGLSGGLADLRYVRATERDDPLTPQEEEVLTRGGMPPVEVDQYALAKRIRRAREEYDRAADAAVRWLVKTSERLPGLTELSRIGDRPLVEFRDWMTRDHAWLAEDGLWPQGVWDTERALIERKWREHVRGVWESGS